MNYPVKQRQRGLAGPSESFLNLTRKPSLKSPKRFEPTAKSEGDIVL